MDTSAAAAAAANNNGAPPPTRPRPLPPPGGACRRPVMVPVHRISLRDPRPDTERHSNEYIATPLRGGPDGENDRLKPLSPTTTASSLSLGTSVITAQPFKSKRKPPPPDVVPSSDHPVLDDDAQQQHGSEDSIICAKCGKCKCLECSKPRRLPSSWLWGRECSPSSALECVTCLCCVKGLLYHARREGDSTSSWADRPCSCGPHLRCQRWTCLAGASLALPCLCLYPPLKGLLTACEKSYSAFTRRGCTCSSSSSSSSSTSSSASDNGARSTSGGSSSRTLVSNSSRREKGLLDSFSSSNSDC